MEYLQDNHLINSNTKIVDIGGGDGNVISYIGSKHSINKENLIVVDKEDQWTEQYAHSNPITYKAWDNKIIDIPSGTVDIVFIMVTLHHMDNETIASCLSEAHRILKNGGLILMKEHNCDSAGIKEIIDWEHHLYHLIERDNDDVHDYMTKYIDNFKISIEWDAIFTRAGLNNIRTFNRFFEPISKKPDTNNVTALYWKIYQKS